MKCSTSAYWAMLTVMLFAGGTVALQAGMPTSEGEAKVPNTLSLIALGTTFFTSASISTAAHASESSTRVV